MHVREDLIGGGDRPDRRDVEGGRAICLPRSDFDHSEFLALQGQRVSRQRLRHDPCVREVVAVDRLVGRVIRRGDLGDVLSCVAERDGPRFRERLENDGQAEEVIGMSVSDVDMRESPVVAADPIDHLQRIVLRERGIDEDGVLVTHDQVRAGHEAGFRADERVGGEHGFPFYLRPLAVHARYSQVTGATVDSASKYVPDLPIMEGFGW